MSRRWLVSAPLVAALAVPFAPAPGAGATTVHSTCVALGTYVMRHRGPLPLAATRPATIVFPGPFGSGTLLSVGGEYGGIGTDTQIWTWQVHGSILF